MIYRTRLVALKPGEPTWDDFGNPVPGPSVETPFYGELRPLTGDERADGTRDLVKTRFKVYTPPSVDLTAYDSVRALGQDYSVVGEPEPHNVGGRVHHYEVLVERIVG